LDARVSKHNIRMKYGCIRKGFNKEVKINTGRKKINVNSAYNSVTHEVITVKQESNINTNSNIAIIDKII